MRLWERDKNCVVVNAPLYRIRYNFQINLSNWCLPCEMTLRWMSVDLIDDRSKFVQVVAWCRQATSHCLNQCWSRYMAPYGVTKPQWVDGNMCEYSLIHERKYMNENFPRKKENLYLIHALGYEIYILTHVILIKRAYIFRQLSKCWIWFHGPRMRLSGETWHYGKVTLCDCGCSANGINSGKKWLNASPLGASLERDITLSYLEVSAGGG